MSKRKSLSSRRLRGFEKNKVGPVDGGDHVGGNYTAALNLRQIYQTYYQKIQKLMLQHLLILKCLGVDYDSTLDESNKIRSSTGLAASWLSPLGPMTFIFQQICPKQILTKQKVLILI